MMDRDYGIKSGGNLNTASYGVAVYWIDTTKDTNRYAGSSGFTDTNAGEKWGDYIVPSGKSHAFNLLTVGETVEYRSVNVTFSSTGAYDTVRITK
jgi:hypothetical protein